MAASALSLAGAALTGCGQQWVRESESPIVKQMQMAQLDGAATAVPTEQAAPAVMATLEPAQVPEASVMAAEAIAALTPGAPGGEEDTRQASKEAVEKAKADLAKKLGIPASEIAVVVVIGQDFTPNGFYCLTNKGRTSQDEPTVVISGETILLKVQGSQYEYHADGQAVTFCRRLQ
jgi:hypothetical protein